MEVTLECKNPIKTYKLEMSKFILISDLKDFFRQDRGLGKKTDLIMSLSNNGKVVSDHQTLTELSGGLPSIKLEVKLNFIGGSN